MNPQMAPESPSALPDTIPASNGTAALAATEQQGAEAHPSAAPLPLHPPPSTGSTIGPYELIRQLGQGGMGTVFLARDTKLGRLVALKLLTTLTGQGARRFLVEARATARCKHENIVVIHDVNEHDGYPYMVLEYLEGQSLRAFMHDRRPADAAPEIVTAPLPARRAVELMIPVARALACAHDRGIVHRDLKPENIVLEASGPIKVLDFGIAKVREGDASAARTAEGTSRTAGLGLTGEGALLGTLPYMSPEQWGADDIDHHSDLWAVGIMLYELVTGRHPLAPLSVLALAKVADLDTPMPSAATARPGLGPLGALIDRCLRKRKAERIASAAELLADLEALLPGKQALALADDGSPFAGLAAFQEADAARFFGRERDITSALGRLRHNALLAIAGPSGAGKSSFVRAGIIPALKRSGEGWEAFIVRPGGRPLAALAELCAQVAPEAEEGTTLPQLLREVPGYLGAALRARCRKAAHRALLFVDQFEELYTLGADKDERAAFIACLEGAADDASSPLRLVLSVRSDFLDRMADDRALMAAVTRGLCFLPPLGRDGLREALLRPLQATGYGFERQDMVDAMLDALERTASPLPLLQFTAARLWEERDRDRRLLTRASYDALGGVEGALATHADVVMAGLSAREQRLARAIFLHLVTPERTRAVVTLADLRELDDGDAIERVVLRLSDARLVQIEHGEENAGATVELVHESLIERWPRLGRWLGESQEEAAFLSRARTAAKQWEASGHVEGLLWRGQAAEEARRWLVRLRAEGDADAGPTHAALGKRDARYLRAVVALEQRARQRRRQLAVATIASLGVIALVVSSLAVRARQEAARAAEQAQRADDEAAHARVEAVQARNTTRVAVARERMDDPTTVLALVREIEPGATPHGWGELAQWALQSGIARIVLDHPEAVVSAQFSPDGKHLATACFDRIARVFHADGSGQPIVFKGHEGPVRTAAFSPDGARIVTASDDRTARVWSADGSGQPIVLRGHADQLTSAAFSPDGTRIVTSSFDKTARIWNADGSGQPIVLQGHKDALWSAAWSPDGKRIATASDDKSARVWSADGSGQPIVLEGHEERVMSAAFSPDGERIVTASFDKAARIWNADGSGQPIVLKGHTEAIWSAAWSPDGKRIVTSSADKTARVWSADGSGKPTVLEGHDNLVMAAAWSPDGKHIVTSSADKTAREWDVDGTDRPLILRGHDGMVGCATFSPDGRRIVTSSADKTARVWNADGQGAPIVLRGHEHYVTCALFSPDGKRVVTSSLDKTARVWNADGQGAPLIFRGHEHQVISAAFSPDGEHIVTSSLDKTARVWNADGRGAPIVLRGHEDYLISAAFSPDGERIITASRDRTARVWNADGSGKPIVLRGHEAAVRSAAFSPDGKRIVTASEDKTVRVWSADGRGEPLILKGHDAIITWAEFSPDGAHIITSSMDETIRIWKPDGTGDPVILRGASAFMSASFSPDGKRIIAGSEDKTVRVWNTIEPLRGASDPRLWTATTYCMPIERRIRLLDTPEDLARQNQDTCLRLVREAQQGPATSTPAP
uniref:Protein kinase n=1 Tax=Byssovorax cruenta TaxID=293647 RepID=A0A3S7UZ87_9BACT|nr:protein kinase [Byssovorax cruenta]